VGVFVVIVVVDVLESILKKIIFNQEKNFASR
jgi:hypothetical protein